MENKTDNNGTVDGYVPCSLCEVPAVMAAANGPKRLALCRKHVDELITIVKFWRQPIIGEITLGDVSYKRTEELTTPL
jgi:hypothetical protein